jgi:biotin carboxylase
MHRCVEQHGINIIPQIQTDDVEVATAWAERQNGWPVVVKDVLGGSSPTIF